MNFFCPPKLVFQRTSIAISLLFLFINNAFPQAESSRVISLKVAADEEFRSSERWPVDIRQLIKEASSAFEKHFGIRFEVKAYENWPSDNAINSTLELLNDLRKKVTKGDNDIVLGFTSQPRLINDLSGVATYLNGYVVVRELPSKLDMKFILIHDSPTSLERLTSMTETLS